MLHPTYRKVRGVGAVTGQLRYRHTHEKGFTTMTTQETNILNAMKCAYEMLGRAITYFSSPDSDGEIEIGNAMNRDTTIHVAGGRVEIDGGPDFDTDEYDDDKHKPEYVQIWFE